MQFNGFRPVRMVNGSTTLPQTEYWPIANSVTIKQGMPVKVLPEQGVDLADAVNDEIYGYCIGFRCKNSLPLASAISGTDYDGTYTASPSGDTYVATSDNETDKLVEAIIIPAKGVVCSVLLSAAAGTTTGSDIVGTYIDILTTNCLKVDESTASTTKANYMLVPGISSRNPKDPADPTTTRVLAIAVETQIQD